jgi:CheY-specific phosphatase CheX/ActR/RegA family two-component response regulator
MTYGYINAFLDSVGDLFSSMLNGTVKRSQVTVAREGSLNGELIAILGLSGSLNGTVSLMLPLETAFSMVGTLVNCTLDQVDETVVDGVAEIANILVGSAKARLALGDGAPLELGLPTVVRGSEVCTYQPSGTMWVELLFDSSHGPFALRVALRRSRTASASGGSGTTRALVIDDSAVMRKVLSGALSRADVKDVEFADDSDAGVRMAAEGKYDLVVIDSDVGASAAMENVKSIRAVNPTAAMLVILAEVDRAHAQDMVRAGATDCLTKPFQPNLLAARVRELLTDHWAREAALSETAR